MADPLADALEKVHISSNSAPNDEDDWIDHILDVQRPRKRVKQDPEDLKKELEQKYLTPSSSFSTPWLNKLQQSVLTQTSPTGPISAAPAALNVSNAS